MTNYVFFSPSFSCVCLCHDDLTGSKDTPSRDLSREPQQVRRDGSIRVLDSEEPSTGVVRRESDRGRLGTEGAKVRRRMVFLLSKTSVCDLELLFI